MAPAPDASAWIAPTSAGSTVSMASVVGWSGVRIQDQPEPSITPSGDNLQSRELRTYGIGAQIIADLGVRKMQVLSAPTRLTGLSGFGLEIVDYIEPGVEL